jgi:hypothetical protein
MTILGVADSMLEGPESGDANRFAPASQAISPTGSGACSPMARGIAAQWSGHVRTISHVPKPTTRQDKGRPSRQ